MCVGFFLIGLGWKYGSLCISNWMNISIYTLNLNTVVKRGVKKTCKSFPNDDHLFVSCPCSGVWRSHNWSSVWTYSVSRISSSVWQQSPLYLDYRGWYGQDYQVIIKQRNKTISACRIALLWPSLLSQLIFKSNAAAIDYVSNLVFHRLLQRLMA